MPYRSEHSARLTDPKKYVRFRRENDRFGKGIHAIWGITASGKVELQAIRFSVDKFTVEEAKRWLAEHKFNPILFEPATQKQDQDMIDATELNAKLHTAGEAHARALIRAGKTKDSESWQPPSAEAENRYIDENGMAAFGRWHLGVDPEMPEDTKGRYKYIFTDDFKTVNRRGLTAIRQRAGQQDDNSVFDAAGRLLELSDKDEESIATPADAISLSAEFSAGGEVNEVEGSIKGVSVVAMGEAKGHGIMIDRTFLEQVVAAAKKTRGGVRTRFSENDHTGGIATVVGAVQKLRVKSNKVIGDLKLLRGHPAYRRIMEIAREIPHVIGLSLVFRGTPEQKDDGLLYARCEDVFFCDLVAAPAANPTGLFNQKQDAAVDIAATDNMQTETKIEELVAENARLVEARDALLKERDDFKLRAEKAEADVVLLKDQLARANAAIEKANQEFEARVMKAVAEELAKRGVDTALDVETKTDEPNDVQSMIKKYKELRTKNPLEAGRFYEEKIAPTLFAKGAR